MAEYKAKEEAKRLFKKDFEAQPEMLELDPIDPVRRAKRIDGVPTREPGDTPNGTAQSKKGHAPDEEAERKSSSKKK